MEHKCLHVLSLEWSWKKTFLEKQPYWGTVLKLVVSLNMLKSIPLKTATKRSLKEPWVELTCKVISMGFYLFLQNCSQGKKYPTYAFQDSLDWFTLGKWKCFQLLIVIFTSINVRCSSTCFVYGKHLPTLHGWNRICVWKQQPTQWIVQIIFGQVVQFKWKHLVIHWW